jgi:hypothetical protein
MEQRYKRWLLDIVLIFDAQVAHLFATPDQDFLRIGQQHTELESQVNEILVGEDAAEVAAAWVAIADAMPHRVS